MRYKQCGAEARVLDIMLTKNQCSEKEKKAIDTMDRLGHLKAYCNHIVMV